jgi:hypothetical protein
VSEEDADRLTPPQERARDLLAPFREERAPHGEALTHAVTRTARWQRPVRRAVLAVGTAAAAVGAGLGSLARGGRAR